PRPRYLHSFPTRRSSDLALRKVGVRDHAHAPPRADGLAGQEAGPPDGVLSDLGEDRVPERLSGSEVEHEQHLSGAGRLEELRLEDRKSTRLNSSHVAISY